MIKNAEEKLSQEKLEIASKTYWVAIYSLSVLTFLLVGLEFMPVSLLTPIAKDFAISEGQAGNSIVISAVVAILSSLFGGRVFSRIDRKSLVLFYSCLLMLSSLIIGLAPNFYVLLAGRVLIGLAIGGFWSLSTAIVARLAKSQDFPHAITILQIGPVSALVLAAPIGSYLETIIGWRMTFFTTIPCGLLLVIVQFYVLPKIPTKKFLVMSDMSRLLNKSFFAIGMVSIALCFIGMNAIYVYLRPFLEIITKLQDNKISTALLIIGIGGFIGLFLIGRIIKLSMLFALIGIQALLALIGVLLIFLGFSPIYTLILLFFWGVLTSPFMVAWNTWMTYVIPDDLEAGGGLQVALIQLAIAGGAFLGGIFHDYINWWSGFLLGSLMLIISTFVGYVAAKKSPINIR